MSQQRGEELVVEEESAGGGMDAGSVHGCQTLLDGVDDCLVVFEVFSGESEGVFEECPWPSVGGAEGEGEDFASSGVGGEAVVGLGRVVEPGV